MTYKDLVKQQECQAAYYQANKLLYSKRNRDRRNLAKRYVQELKAVSPCTDCGVIYPHYVMDFDHLADKLKGISVLAREGNLEEIKREIEKCEIVCANCHRIRTWERATHAGVGELESPQSCQD